MKHFAKEDNTAKKLVYYYKKNNQIFYMYIVLKSKRKEAIEKKMINKIKRIYIIVKLQRCFLMEIRLV